MFDHELLIGSAFVAGAEAKEKILNPKTGALLTELAEASVEQVDAAVEAASKAFDAWARTTPAERSRLLLKLADAIESAGEDFATLEALNCGKPRIRVLEDEIPAIADCFRFRRRRENDARRCVRRVCRQPHVDDPSRSDRCRRVHRAVELPLMMAAWKLAPRLPAAIPS